jgi:hypothetical protein
MSTVIISMYRPFTADSIHPLLALSVILLPFFLP